MNVSREEEGEMIKKAQSGDTSAYEVLVRDSIDRLYRVALGFTRSDSDAEDMVQEACFKAFLSIGRFRGDSSFRTWVTRILINQCKDFLRSRNRGPQASDEAAIAEGSSADHAGSILASAFDPPDQWAARGEMREAIRMAIGRLPAEEKTVAVLVWIDGQSYSEAALVMGESEGTIAWRIYEARRKLCRWLDDYREEIHGK